MHEGVYGAAAVAAGRVLCVVEMGAESSIERVISKMECGVDDAKH